MEMKSKRDGDKLTLWLQGDVCADCVPATEAFLKENIAGVKNLTVDFGGVGKFANEGLMLLLSTKKKLGDADLTMVNVSEELYDRLEEQGVTTLMNVVKAV